MSVVDTKVPCDETTADTDGDGADCIRELESLHVDDSDHTSSRQEPRRISLSLRSIALAVAACAVVAAIGTLSWLYFGARAQLAAQDHAAADRKRAEGVALDYSVNAALMDYQDFNGWKVKLVNGTSPALKDKLTKAADSMQQILAPLQWKSTSRPLAAKVRSEADGVYTVDSFVSVLTKTVQAPDGLQSTATYSVTLDSKNNWQITDVGGIDAALGK
jgi:Mce-associated membrane protein